MQLSFPHIIGGTSDLHYPGILPLLLLLLPFTTASLAVELPSLQLARDAALLLSFKSSIFSDRISSLTTWNSSHLNPCTWFGITCSSTYINSSTQEPEIRVTAIDLSGCLLFGTLSTDLGIIQHLSFLNLSNNSLNGSLPESLFSSPELRILDLSNNFFSGELPAMQKMTSLVSLNLSDNAISGDLPGNVFLLPYLKTACLRRNNFSGNMKGFVGGAIERLDLSSNMISGTLPADFQGKQLRYFNVSFNRISGTIPAGFSGCIPATATLDISHNNLSGEIPVAEVFYNQEPLSFFGNLGLCGKPMNKTCLAAIAVMPSALGAAPPYAAAAALLETRRRRKFSPGAIAGIVVANLIAICFIASFSAYAVNKMKRPAVGENEMKSQPPAQGSNFLSSKDGETEGCWWKKGRSSSKNKAVEEEEEESGVGRLVTTGGDEELEMEKLLRASAYIMGGSGSKITYKAVMEDGSAVVVRRLGECSGVGQENMKEFEGHVRIIAKIGQHPNLNQVRGFYWSRRERLIVSDYVSGGSLAGIRQRKKGGCSPCPLPWELRLKIAKGVASGLLRLHEKRQVHGNLKPTNILLGSEMEPKIADYGLDRIAPSFKLYGSLRVFTTASRDLDRGPGPSHSDRMVGLPCVYQPPESSRSLKKDSKWDVYSFGVVLLELVTGKTRIVEEMEGGEKVVVDTGMVDVAIRCEVGCGEDDTVLACLRLGLACVSPSPQKRPSMKEVVQMMEKMRLVSPSKPAYV